MTKSSVKDWVFGAKKTIFKAYFEDKQKEFIIIADEFLPMINLVFCEGGAVFWLILELAFWIVSF